MSHATHSTASAATGRPTAAYTRLALTVLGAGMLWWSAYIHLRLYFNGFDNIPTIGRLFMAQGVAASVVGLVVIATRRVDACLVGALLLVATIAGFIWTDLFGLFGFDETFSEAYAGLSLVVEVVGAAALGAVAVLGTSPDGD